MKTCLKCDTPKELGDFYTHPKMADGHLGKCKECCKSDVTANRAAKVEQYREFDRNRANLSHRVEAREIYAKGVGRPKCDAAKRKWIERNPRKRAAEVLFGNYIRGKEHLKLPCERCGSTTRVHAHHENYDEPLTVNWLCPKHHKERHREMLALGIEP